LTTTRDHALKWERVGGAHEGVAAQYGDWQFRVYAWQPGSYLAVASNPRTSEYHEQGNRRGEVRTQRLGKEFCQQRFAAIVAADRAKGIERE
jgi:hypothetical protein